MWTKEDLEHLIKNKLGDYQFIVASNRQPFEHIFRKGKIGFQRGAGGVITALDPVMRVCDEDVPLPYAANLEKIALIDAARIVAAVKKVCNRG